MVYPCCSAFVKRKTCCPENNTLTYNYICKSILFSCLYKDINTGNLHTLYYSLVKEGCFCNPHLINLIILYKSSLFDILYKYNIHKCVNLILVYTIFSKKTTIFYIFNQSTSGRTILLEFTYAHSMVKMVLPT